MTRTLALVLSLATLAAAGEPAVKIAAAKGKDWAKLVATTATYEIQSDADAKTLQQVAVTLEDLHRAFVETFKEQVKSEDVRGLLQVRFYKTRKAFLANMQMGGPPGARGGGGPPMPGGGDGGPGGYYDPGSKTLHTALEQPGGDDWMFVLKHEGTHQLLHNRLGIGGGQPGVTSAVWFNEGFASYWAMTVWKGKDVVEGGVMKKLLDEFKQAAKGDTLLSLKELVGGAMNPMMMRAYYSQGWGLCHFLRASRFKEKFAAYCEKERAGKVSWEEFVEALGIQDEEAFEKEYVAHVMKLR